MRYFQNLTGSLPVRYCKILPGALLKILVLRYLCVTIHTSIHTSIILNLMHLCWNLVQEWIFKSSNKWILLLHELKKPKARFWGFGWFLEKKSTFCGFWVTSNVHFFDALLVRYFGWNDWCVTFPQNWVINYFFKRYFCVTVKPCWLVIIAVVFYTVLEVQHFQKHNMLEGYNKYLKMTELEQSRIWY